MVSVQLELPEALYRRLVDEAEILNLDFKRYLVDTLGGPAASIQDFIEGATPDEALSGTFQSTLQEQFRLAMRRLNYAASQLQEPILKLQYRLIQRSLEGVQRQGLSGDHHFYIAFQTDAAEVQLGDDLKAQYPETMTIALENQFSNLEVDDAGFSVNLTFGGVPRRLDIPFHAVVAFVDPSTELEVAFPFRQWTSADSTEGEAAESKAVDAKAADAATGEPTAAAAEQQASLEALVDEIHELLVSPGSENPGHDAIGPTLQSAPLEVLKADPESQAELESKPDPESKAEPAAQADPGAEDDPPEDDPPPASNVVSFAAFRKK